MPELATYVVNQIAVGAVVWFFTALNEGRRMRVSANFSQKQQHYAELFEVIYKVTKGLRLSATNTFTAPGTFDVTQLEADLNTKDSLRIDALNHIWASKNVQDAVAIWIEGRIGFLRNAQMYIDLGESLDESHRKELREAALAALEKAELQLGQVQKLILNDLLLSKRDISRLFAR